MIIKNISKNTVVAKDAKFLSTLKEKSLGLLLKSNSRSLIFKTHFGIHTFGLKKPIDILILDDTLKVAKLRSYLKPNTFFLWNIKNSLVLETPAGTIQKTETQKGDIIWFG